MRLFSTLLLAALVAAVLGGCGGAVPIFGSPQEVGPPPGVSETRITCYEGGGALSGVGVGAAQGSFHGVRVSRGNDAGAAVTYSCDDPTRTVRVGPDPNNWGRPATGDP